MRTAHRAAIGRAVSPPTRRRGRWGWTVPLLTALAACGFACGRKTAPLAPAVVRPASIQQLSAANGAEGILVTWERPKQQAGGGHLQDLGAFRLYRSADNSAFAEIAVLEITDRDRFRQLQKFRYLDVAVAPGVTYRYVVRSTTLDGYVSDDSNVFTLVRRPPTPPPTTIVATPSP
jgi:hypothetical protein